jgi:hypothetical protein
MKNTILISLFLTASLFTGCATLVQGPKQIIDFSSQPSGAVVSVDGKSYGTTPVSLILDRKCHTKDGPKEKNYYDVKIELDGYQPYTMRLDRKVSGWVYGNIIFSYGYVIGIAGVLIDASTGSMYKLTPNQVNATLEKAPFLSTGNDRLYIGITLNPDPALEKIGQLVKAN